MRRPAAALLAACVLIPGCATTALPPVMDKGFAFQEDERRLWTRSGEIQGMLGKSGWLLRDESIEGYLSGVAAKLAPPEAGGRIPFRVLVIRDHRLNAFAFANGAVYIHTGILAEMENEAQLAVLLAHEMSHATHRHAVRSFRDMKNKSA
ncbi:MAG: M48 family metalloprotease, partial [Gemmatimonadota bacterium]